MTDNEYEGVQPTQKPLTLVCTYTRIISTKGYPLLFAFKPDKRVEIKIEKEINKDQIQKLLRLASQWLADITLLEIKRD